VSDEALSFLKIEASYIFSRIRDRLLVRVLLEKESNSKKSDLSLRQRGRRVSENLGERYLLLSRAVKYFEILSSCLPNFLSS